MALALALWTLMATAAEYRLGDLVLATPWARATPPTAAVAGGYLRITNTGDAADRLLGGEAAFAGDVQVHATRMEDGVMRMREMADGVEIPPGESVALEPGGLHLMLTELAEPLVEGEPRAITLTFERAGTIELTFEVAPIGADAPPAQEPIPQNLDVLQASGVGTRED